MNSLKAAVLFTIVCLAGCAHLEQKPLAAESRDALQGKSITFVEHAKPDFGARIVNVSAGKTASGAIDSGSMVLAGNAIISENGIDDPAIHASHQLLDMMARSHGVQVGPRVPVIANTDDISALSSLHPGFDYLLDVKTVDWWFGYFRNDPAHHHVFYTAKMRLIDTQKNEVIAQTLCEARPIDAGNPVSKRELLADEAKLLKANLQKAADDCAGVFASEVLQVR